VEEGEARQVSACQAKAAAEVVGGELRGLIPEVEAEEVAEEEHRQGLRGAWVEVAGVEVEEVRR
jgi:hypothetical protein